MNTNESSKIFFGKVVDVKDESFIHRVKCVIQGFTEQIPPDDLPLYFPFYGVNFLPLVDDIVPVIIFDDDFTKGFYGRKIDVVSRELEEADYENYLEIFKRAVEEKNVQLTYTPSLGIQFINDTTSQQMEVDKLTFMVGENKMFMDAEKIELGADNLEPTLLGDKTVAYLQEQIKASETIMTQTETFMKSVASAAMGSPYTASVGSAINSGLPSWKQAIKSQIDKCKDQVTKIQSEKVFNN